MDDENARRPMPGIPLPLFTPKPTSTRPSRKLLDPEPEGNACLYMTSHAAQRLQERFISGLKPTPFPIFTHYCDQLYDDPVWVIPLKGGYMLGRWEETLRTDLNCKHWYVATTCITDRQFKNSGMRILKSVQINVVKVANERQFLLTKNF